ncbi:cadherin-related member 4 [Porites harrisoni]
MASACVVVLLAVVTVLLWRKHAKKRVRMLESREPHLRPNRGLVNGEKGFYKGKIKQHKMISPIMIDNQIAPPDGKRFDGKAVDPVSGKLYAFNKTTGERMWIQDMRDNRNGPLSYYANRNTQSRFSDSQHRVQDLPPPRASIETVHGRDYRANRLQLPGTPE